MNKRLPFLFLFLAPIAAVLAFRPVHVLEITFNDFNLLVPLSGTSTLSVEYTHSVSLTKVVDVYRINESGIYAYEEKWQEFLAGQPLNGSPEGEFFVKRLDKSLGKEWMYWFIEVNHFRLVLDGRPVFEQPAEDGLLVIRVKEVPAFKAHAGW